MSAAMRSVVSSRWSPGQLLTSGERPVGEVFGVRPSRAVAHLRIVFELFGGKATDGFEHRDASATGTAVDLLHQALVHQRAERIDNVDVIEPRHAPRDGLDGLERGAGKHREHGDQSLLVVGEQFVAPADRVAQGAVAGGRVARAAGQQVEPVAEPFDQRLG